VRADPAVVARDLVKTYGEFVAVSGVSFEVPARSCFGFLGPNGAGKTTTMRMIACSLPPTSGALEVLGMDVRAQPRAIKDRMGVVPQEESLDEDVTVLDNLLIYARYFGLPRTHAISRADELLEYMALSEKREREISELSGGMKRRLLIARALMNEPEVLILDEPTTGLDPQARHLVWEKLRSLKRMGVTLLLTTHYMEEAAQLCDRLVIMHEGRVLVEGAPRELVKAHTTSEVVEVIEPPDELKGEIEQIADRASLERLPDRWLIYTEDGEKVLGRIRTLDIDPGLVWLRGGSLEDVFLVLTGRGLLE